MTLKALKREILGKKVKQLRATDSIPASIFGAQRNPSLSVTLNRKEFREAFKECGYSKIITVEVEGEDKPIKAVFKELQTESVKNAILHVSLMQVQMDKKITAEIPLKFVGVSLAVKNNLGLLITSQNTIHVSCLPDDLPSEIEIDVAVLNNVGDTILLNQVVLPKGVEVGHGTAKDAALAYISAPQKIEEETAVAATTDAAAAAPAEGDAAATTAAAKPAAKK
jgi:large subunit ribosomal protein L25